MGGGVTGTGERRPDLTIGEGGGRGHGNGNGRGRRGRGPSSKS